MPRRTPPTATPAPRLRRPVALAVALAVVGGAVAAAAAVFVPGSASQVASAGPESRPAAASPLVETARRTRRRPPGRPELPRVTIVAVGDITLGSTPSLPSGGPGPLLAGVRSELDADVVLGNLETSLTSATGSKCPAREPEDGDGAATTATCFAFRAPPEYARGLARAGFDVLNVANNHSRDFGQAGFAQTVEALRAAGIRVAGGTDQIAFRRAGGVRVAVLGFAPNPGFANLLDLPAARALVRTARREADVVVVTFHGGAEGAEATRVRPGSETFLGMSRGDVVAFAHAVVDAGADLVVGHGPHVLRGMEWYRGRLIAYSLGNFSGYETLNTAGSSGVSAILSVTLREDGTFLEGRVVPIRLVGAGVPIVDRSRLGLRAIRTLSRLDFRRRAVSLERRGLIPGRPPVKLSRRVVRKVQARLAEIGYYEGRRDGRYGLEVEAAVYAFQRDAGVAPSGVYGPETRAALAAALAALEQEAET